MSGGFAMTNTLFVEDANAGKKKWRKPLKIVIWTIVALAVAGGGLAVYDYIVVPLIK
jgi:hypothetical protein